LRTVGDVWGRLEMVGDGWRRLGMVGDGRGTGTVGDMDGREGDAARIGIFAVPFAFRASYLVL
jgi:hypothetical protein